MKLSDAARLLGIFNYPPALDDISVVQAFPYLEILRQLETEHKIFGQYYCAIEDAVKSLHKDPARQLWARTVSTYILHAPVALAGKVPMPATDGNIVGDMLPIVILLPLIPRSIATYRAKGFTENEIRDLNTAYADGIRIVSTTWGRAGVNQLYYWWLCLYAKASIFHTGNLMFELCSLPKTALWLHNKKTGVLTPIMCENTFHRSGQVLGSAGCEDPQGSFTTTIEETPEGWYGFPASSHGVSSKKTFFPKSDWRCSLRPGDPILNIHIPRNVPFHQDAVMAALGQALRIVKDRFPEHGAQNFYCHSWLLDPQLEQILGSNTNIVRFGSLFTRHPIRNSGKDCFVYAFPPGCTIDHTAPQDTRLRRGLLSHHLSGGYILGCAGLYIPKGTPPAANTTQP